MNISAQSFKHIIFIFLASLISFLFVVQAFHHANTKAFWTDEEMTLNITLNQSYGNILWKGAKNQGSPSPLEYLALKVLKQLKSKVHSFGLSFNTYYRLNSIFYTVISGMLVMIFASKVCIFRYTDKPKIGVYLFQIICLLSALSLYYFLPENFHFAIEMRPYALWNSLWMLSLSLFMFDEKCKGWLIVSLTLLALTATASLFQLFAFALSFMIIKQIYKNPFKETLIACIQIFILPTIICLYYVLNTTQTWNYGQAERYWEEFWYFWVHSQRVFIVSVLGIILTSVSKKFQSHRIVFMTMGVLYLMAPAINYITILKGFFFSPRQYRYYPLIYPLVFMSSACVFPEITKSFLKQKYALLRIFLMVFLLGYLGYLFYVDYGINKTERMTQMSPASQEYLIQLSQGTHKGNAAQLKKYKDYYLLLTRYMPHRADAYGMLGFCYYYMGKTHQAMRAYQKAIIRNDAFFWYYYNLGVMYYKNGQYVQAIEVLEKSLNVDYKETFKSIIVSKHIYQPILEEQKRKDKQWLKKQILRGYQNCYVLLVASYRQIGENQKAIIFLQRAERLMKNKQLLKIKPKDIELEVY